MHSGWIEQPTFLKWMEHFIEHVKPSRAEPVLLIIDGHTSHTKNIEAIEHARESGVIMISLPPHCTDRLQPLDVAFFKPLKTHYRQAAHSWMRNHPGQKISPLNVSSLFAEAYMKSATMTTAANGFAACGIWPCRRDVFQKKDFMPAAAMAQCHHLIRHDLRCPKIHLNVMLSPQPVSHVFLCPKTH